MTDVSAIGLGAMGGALARAFVGAGHAVTVWNRSAQRMAPLVALGAAGAETLAQAVAASPVVVVCIDSYAATEAAFAAPGASAALSGRTLVQLSTGAPSEARAAAAWAARHGAAYLDGAIMPYPQDIGAPDAQILFAGPEPAYAGAKPLLDCLGGDLRYLGANVAAAAVLDMALLTHQLCNYLGGLHGARLCESEGVAVETLAGMFPARDPVRRLLRLIHQGDYGDPGATLTVWNAALMRIVQQARDAGINAEIPDLIASLFARSIAAGHGDHDVAAVIETLRAGGGRDA